MIQIQCRNFSKKYCIIETLPTRWLSLGPAVEGLLQSWPAFVSYSYFKSLGTDCPKRVAKCLALPATEANEQDDGGIQLSITEAYLQFSLNLCNTFEKTVLQLESDSVTFCELYPITSQLRDMLKDRLADRFFGCNPNS